MTQTNTHIAAIDGLRAVAVFAIILFHLDRHIIPAGFVGVDVFYVISGFVVTISARYTNFDNILGFAAWFYRRRFMRIYPVLMSFLIVSFILWTLFIPEGYAGSDTFMTGVLALFGMSNIGLFITTGGYFGTLAEYNIFTHTWSLGVEEQYYLLFPFFSYCLVFRPKIQNLNHRIVFTFILCAILISLATAAATSDIYPIFAFFIMPARFWELGLGFVAAQHIIVVETRRTPWTLPVLPDWATVGCIIALGMSIAITPQEGFPFPGAVLPCLSTAGLLVAAYQQRSIFIKFLEAPAIVWIGKLSFSLYLWHWLVIVGMRWTVGIETWATKLGALFVILVLSACSYYAIEIPVRHSKRLSLASTRTFYLVFATTVGVVASLFGALKLAKPYLSFVSSADEQIWSPYSSPPLTNARCQTVETSRYLSAGAKAIELRPTDCNSHPQTLFVIGDSHAGAYLRGLRSLSAREGYRIQIYTRGGCHLLKGVQVSMEEKCDDFAKLSTSMVVKQASSGDVLFLPALYVKRYRDYWDGSILQTSELETTPRKEDLLQAELDANMLKAFLDRGVKVLLEAPKPLLTMANFRCADWISRRNTYCSAEPATRDDEQLRRLRTFRYLEAIAMKDDDIRVFDPFPVLCPETTCSGWIDGHPVFNDTDHLSGFGNDLLVPKLAANIKALLSRK